jgi:opacity protein-like surface antigen
MKKIALVFVVLTAAVSSASAQNRLPKDFPKIMGGGYGPYGIGTNKYGTLVNPQNPQRKQPQPSPNRNAGSKLH